jgi:DnaJ-class molecular chaperone
MEYRDYYRTLGVPRDASDTDIKKAFRKLARKHHPDVNRSDPNAEARFKEVNEAYAVLSDPEKRKMYDRLGADWEMYQRAGGGQPGAGGGAYGFPGGGFTGGFRGAGGNPGGVRFEYRGNAEDLSGFSDFFRAFFGGGAGEPSAARGRTGTRLDGDIGLDDLLGGITEAESRARRGADRRSGGTGRAAPRQDPEADVEISLEEAFSGTERLVQVGDRRLEVRIPAGVEDGRRIRLSGSAGSGPEAADVYLRVRVRPHAVFTREGGADLARSLALTLGEALLGAEVPVGTIAGRTLLLRIPAGTQNGQTFRLRGQGLPRFRGEGRGDLLVRTHVVLPTGLDDGGRRIAEDLVAHAHQPNPREGERETAP